MDDDNGCSRQSLVGKAVMGLRTQDSGAGIPHISNLGPRPEDMYLALAIGGPITVDVLHK
ncbi:hypothetical protein PanWU01x14_289710 [Parasponia andersonii]|uniref:Uncharacterized protein n=1 Tax=Parasponia andersonii TaxID=3476 RepID=A0A2P5AY60_PARAD|nr:hypothetical protein PanWU01x14_289710 [Parasponia andersonii]